MFLSLGSNTNNRNSVIKGFVRVSVIVYRVSRIVGESSFRFDIIIIDVTRPTSTVIETRAKPGVALGSRSGTAGGFISSVQLFKPTTLADHLTLCC